MKDYILGKVQWFDNIKGEGMVVDTNESSYYVHYSAIDSKDIFKTLCKGNNVEFSLYENLYSKQVDYIKEV